MNKGQQRKFIWNLQNYYIKRILHYDWQSYVEIMISHAILAHHPDMTTIDILLYLPTSFLVLMHIQVDVLSSI